MGAGAVMHATRTRNLEEMGGLIKRMPHTAMLFLTGSVAIAALPPFNGFISEWLTFQSLLMSFQIPARGVNLVFVLSIAALALTGGLAAACFIKAFGIAFLALPRSERAERAHEAGLSMRTAMALLAAACLALGVAPFVVLKSIGKTVSDLLGATPDMRSGWSGLVVHPPFASVSPLGIAMVLLMLLALLPLVWRVTGASRTRRLYETWGCGRAVQTARFEYTAAAFANPFKRVFNVLYRPVKELSIEFHPESRFFVQSIYYRNEARSIFEEAIYGPLMTVVRSVAERVRGLQSGHVNLYLLYILTALVVLLMLAR
jgi:hydrogenase-4 component B